MKQYQDLVARILEDGIRQENRTGIDTVGVIGAHLPIYMRNGFPALTTKKVAFKTAIAELVGFLRGYTSAADFRRLGCKVWDQNANENEAWLENPNRKGTDDLGPVYGAQWRGWPVVKIVRDVYDMSKPESNAAFQKLTNAGFDVEGWEKTSLGDIYDKCYIAEKSIDQLRDVVTKIMTNPTSRQIIMHAWNVSALDEMALPPCHLLYQFHVDVARKRLSMTLFVRSQDVFLGMPFNIVEAAALLHLIARLTGLEPHMLNYMVSDAHIYVNHVEQCQEQLARQPHMLPRLLISDLIPTCSTVDEAMEWIERVEPSDFELVDYEHHPALTGAMAV